MDKDDSEQFPVEVCLGCFEDLIESLSVLLGLKKEKQLSIVLKRSETIISCVMMLSIELRRKLNKNISEYT